MTTNIIEALTKLSKTIDKLDTVSQKQEERMLELKQQDLFGAGEQAPANDSKDSFNTEQVVAKLDSAIARVEQVLTEG